jgi:hypothetical protein
MPIDPKTGERLPYPGEPGAEGNAQAPAEEAVSDQQVDELLGRIAAVEGEAAPEGEPAPEGEVPVEDAEAAEEGAEGAQDLSPLVESLGVTEERAQMLFDAAQQLDSTKGKSPDELAKIIVDDFDILMQLEVIAARGMQNQPEPPAPEAAAPGGPEAAGMPPEMMPPGGM